METGQEVLGRKPKFLPFFRIQKCLWYCFVWRTEILEIVVGSSFWSGFVCMFVFVLCVYIHTYNLFFHTFSQKLCHSSPDTGTVRVVHVNWPWPIYHPCLSLDCFLCPIKKNPWTDILMEPVSLEWLLLHSDSAFFLSHKFSLKIYNELHSKSHCPCCLDKSFVESMEQKPQKLQDQSGFDSHWYF